MVGRAAISEGLVLEGSLRAPAGSDWRGAMAAQRGSEIHALCRQIVQAAQKMVIDCMYEPDMPDRKWKQNGEALSALFGLPHSEDLSIEEMQRRERRIKAMASETRRLLQAQPTVIRVPVPAKVFGDVHGQLRDLLLLFGHYGFPSHHWGGDIETTTYIFNGDWVDRGAHQIEVVMLLFALKCLYPGRVFLVRGNHEFRSQSISMGPAGFRSHLAQLFHHLDDKGESAYEAVHCSFDWLPLAAVVGDVVLVLHGGIGDGSWGVRDLSSVGRPLRDEHDPSVPDCVRQALWSDPAESDEEMYLGVHENPKIPVRVQFGADVTASFCKREGLCLVVRSHQYVREGVKLMHGGKLATLFSARNYMDGAQNDSATLLIAPDGQGMLRVRIKRLQQRMDKS
eukprot:CAMPEP_0179453636 /NCGR_PEP_ID=MMETSP0799-20121207/37581_1 /TAXON_ID=46947 /ORGANISM="Geminigera cryophila, Strain CCMP2564" /LENGTH=395 /DNA_ID=CAMNT_0021250875 /DNA_START=32 /DNA_END=1222 /DNA_ORIENTATION=-